MKQDQDEQKQSLRGKAMKAFRKVALPVLATVALAGGMVNEANAQQSTQNTYGTVVTQQQVQQQKPWATNPEYIDQIRLEQQQQNLRLQEVEARARARIATYNANIMKSRSSNVKRIQQLRERGGNALDILAQTQKMSAAEIQHQTRVKGVENDVVEARLDSQENMQRFIDRLDRTYSRMSPYKEILEQQKTQQTQRVTNATTGVQTTAPATTAPRSAAEQEAAIKAAQEKYQQEQLRKFQDAQIKAASEGKPMPKREDFGLPPEQQKQRVSTASLDRN